MISTDDHPPPSHHQQLISHHLNINNDEQPSPSGSHIDLKSPDVDLHQTNPPLNNFSIRDHVFGLRSKDIASNWPFSPKSLQLCLKNGIKNLLPPFQPLQNHEELITSSNGSPKNNDEPKSNEDLTIREKHPQSSQTILKKTRFVMKSASDIVPNSFIVSETMASKVCPVCKVFSSSSNTTLNAHIDQCLTGETSMKWIGNPKVIVKPPKKTKWFDNSTKHKIKPRKTRLMVDVYKTALNCTIEELDRRNGTSWATSLSIPAKEFGFQGKDQEKEGVKISRIDSGDVYIDTDGTKVRILSVPKADNNGGRRLMEGGKRSKFVKKGKIRKVKHHRRFLKVGFNGGKRRSPEAPGAASQAISGQEEEVAKAENHSKEEQCREPMKARMHSEMADLAIGRPPWACSKRTDLVSRHPKNTRSSSPSTASFTKNPTLLAPKFRFKRKFSDIHNHQRSPTPSEKSTDPSHHSSNDQSQTSKSSYSQSSARIETAIDDGLHDVESVRTSDGGLIGLGGFSKLVGGQAVNEFDLPDDLYHGKNIFGNDIEDVEKHENYFEVDPIPIPGPPGSFLPSPRADMSSDEIPANSSLATAINIMGIESSYHHDTVDDSMSNSPVSTVSNPKSDSRSASGLDDVMPATRIAGGFKNHEPCCCSRKEIASNGNPFGLNFISEMFSIPTAKKDDDSAAGRSKPVLRLMGKNLTVVKIDDDASSPSGNQCRSPANPATHQRPVIGQYRNGSDCRYFDVKTPVNGGFMDSYSHGGRKDVVVIHDSPENEGDDSIRNEFMRRNPFYTVYQAPGPSNPCSGGGGDGSGGPSMFPGGGFRTPAAYYPPSYL